MLLKKNSKNGCEETIRVADFIEMFIARKLLFDDDDDDDDE